MKRKLKRKVIWLDEWNIIEQEAWFSDMAFEGWKLIKLGAVFATFEEDEPQEIAYRCDVFNLDDHSDQRRIEYYRESGWEFVDSRKHVQVFREDEAGESSEVYATQIERAETLSLLEKSIRNKGLLMLVLSAFIVLLNIFTLQIDPVQNYLSDSFIIPIYTMITYFYFVIHMFTGIIHMRNLVKSLKLGEIDEDYVDYHKKVSIKKFFSLCGGIFLASLLVYFTIDIIKYDDGWSDKVPQGDLPVVQLSDIMDEMEYEQVVISDHYYDVSSSILIPEQYELSQSVLGNDNEVDESTIRSYGYVARNEWIAQKFSEALEKRFSEFLPVYKLIPHDTFDVLWVGKNHSNLNFIVRKENVVYHLQYDGTDVDTEKEKKILLKIEENL